MKINKFIRVVPNFPKEGISFHDITTLLKNGEAFHETINLFYNAFKDKNIDYVAAIESRGYLFGAPLAYKMGCGLVIIRKPGKLPAAVERIEYDLEYGKDVLEVHKDAIEPGKKVLIVDDLLATGGTISAACNLIEKIGGKVEAAAFVIELANLHGREKLPADVACFSLVKVEE